MPSKPEITIFAFEVDGVVRTQEIGLSEKATSQHTRGFVGQLQEFGGNGRFTWQVRRTWKHVLYAALFGVALLLLSACGGDTESAGGSGKPDGSNTQESTNPISQGCQPPDMENCFGYEDMQAYGNQIVPMVEQFFDTAYTAMPPPAQYRYVREGETGSGACTPGYTDQSYEYCPVDQTIYTGQRALWMYYSEAGDAAPAVGLAHEWGHHVQNVAGVPQEQTQIVQISRENQADCIAGAWVAYADEQKWLNYPDDLGDIETLLRMIAEYEPDRTHGDLDERTNSLALGYANGLQSCNDFFPDSPVITTSSALPSSATATQSPTATPAATDTAEEEAAINAAVDYYQYVQSGDYYTTYDLLSSADQDYYAEDEWVTANTNLDSAAAEYVVTDAYPDDLGLGVPTYAVAVTVNLPDGSSFNRTTYFIYEASDWKHYLSEEEVDTFDSALN